MPYGCEDAFAIIASRNAEFESERGGFSRPASR